MVTPTAASASVYDMIMKLGDDLAMVLSRLRLLSNSVTSMKRIFKDMKNNDQKSEYMDESKDSFADQEYCNTKNIFLKSDSELDLYEMRSKFCMIPFK